jgi:hypothetical protein
MSAITTMEAVSITVKIGSMGIHAAVLRAGI